MVQPVQRPVPGRWNREKPRLFKDMLRTTIVAIVTRCTRRAWLVIGLSTILGVISSVYAVQHFAINTDINKLISPDLPWRKRDLAFEQAFPQHLQSILAVVDAPTPELASQAATALVDRLSQNQELILKISQPGGRSEEHTSELQSLRHLVCRLLLEK